MSSIYKKEYTRNSRKYFLLISVVCITIGTYYVYVIGISLIYSNYYNQPTSVQFRIFYYKVHTYWYRKSDDEEVPPTLYQIQRNMYICTYILYEYNVQNY